jgi:hypothetical protein
MSKSYISNASYLRGLKIRENKLLAKKTKELEESSSDHRFHKVSTSWQRKVKHKS